MIELICACACDHRYMALLPLCQFFYLACLPRGLFCLSPDVWQLAYIGTDIAFLTILDLRYIMMTSCESCIMHNHDIVIKLLNSVCCLIEFNCVTVAVDTKWSKLIIFLANMEISGNFCSCHGLREVWRIPVESREMSANFVLSGEWSPYWYIKFASSLFCCFFNVGVDMFFLCSSQLVVFTVIWRRALQATVVLVPQLLSTALPFSSTWPLRYY